MSFVIESRRPGEQVWYVADETAGLGHPLTGYRNAAKVFETAAHARVVVRRFSSAYNLIVTETAP